MKLRLGPAMAAVLLAFAERRAAEAVGSAIRDFFAKAGDAK